jgi:hypothetical protein
VPLTAAGNLKIVALSDLGGLGAKEGAPVNYEWAMANPAPVLLPWLIILALLLLKPNRNAAACWILVPLACVLVVTPTVSPWLPSGTDFFLDIIAAAAFAVAAVWLLSSSLRQKYRMATLLCMFITLMGCGALTLASRLGLSGEASETMPALIILAIGSLVIAVALTLAGWICRNRYRPLALYPWLWLMLTVVWLVVTSPFFLIALMSSNGGIPWSELFNVVIAVAAGNFALLLPFLILSSISPFYRERLKTLLHVKPEAPPVLPEPSLKAAIQ